MGENLQDLKPREATCPSKSRNAERSWKPFTRLNFMAKWEIRFQRFAISFRPSAKVLMRSSPRGETLRGPPREAESLLRGYAARGNEKFHFPPAFDGNKLTTI
jgi:hypothetical protein